MKAEHISQLNPHDRRAYLLTAFDFLWTSVAVPRLNLKDYHTEEGKFYQSTQRWTTENWATYEGPTHQVFKLTRGTRKIMVLADNRTYGNGGALQTRQLVMILDPSCYNDREFDLYGLYDVPPKPDRIPAQNLMEATWDSRVADEAESFLLQFEKFLSHYL